MTGHLLLYCESGQNQLELKDTYIYTPSHSVDDTEHPVNGYTNT